MIASIVLAFVGIFAGVMAFSYTTGSMEVQAENSPAVEAINDAMCSVDSTTGLLVPILIVLIVVLILASLTSFQGAMR